MDRLNIGIDVDGCVADFSGTYIKLANSMFDLALRPEDQTGWAHQSLGLTDAQDNAVWDRINNTPNWWTRLPKLPNTDTLTEWAKAHRVFFLTKRNPTTVGLSMEDQTANWLRREFFIPNPTVIITEHKGDVARALRLHCFIDDKFENCWDVVKGSPNTYSFLHDAPYNKEIEASLWMRRAQHINDFFSQIKGASNGSNYQLAA